MKEELEKLMKEVDMLRNKFTKCTKDAEDAKADSEACKSVGKDLQEKVEQVKKEAKEEKEKGKLAKSSNAKEKAKAIAEAQRQTQQAKANATKVIEQEKKKIVKQMQEAMNKTMNATLAPAPMRFIDPVILASQMFDKPVPPAASSKEPTPSTHMAEEVSVNELVSDAMDGLRKAQLKASKIVGAADAHSSALDHE